MRENHRESITPA